MKFGLTRACAGLGRDRGLLVLLLASPASAHSVSGVGATNWKSVLTSVTPQLPGLTVKLVEDGSRIELTNRGAEIVVQGYEGEPYLRIGPSGVFENLQSPATYLNCSRTGCAFPAGLNKDGPPEWKKISSGQTARWHDHRAHYMGTQLPPDVARAPNQVHQEATWEILMTQGIDGTFTANGTQNRGLVIEDAFGSNGDSNIQVTNNTFSNISEPDGAIALQRFTDGSPANLATIERLADLFIEHNTFTGLGPSVTPIYVNPTYFGTGAVVPASFDDAQLITGTAGNDTLTDTSAIDTTIVGGPGNDTITVGSGNDTIIYNVGDGRDTVTGGAGVDTEVINDNGSVAQTFEINPITPMSELGVNIAATGSAGVGPATAANAAIEMTSIQEIVINLGSGGDTVCGQRRSVRHRPRHLDHHHQWRHRRRHRRRQRHHGHAGRRCVQRRRPATTPSSAATATTRSTAAAAAIRRSSPARRRITRSRSIRAPATRRLRIRAARPATAPTRSTASRTWCSTAPRLARCCCSTAATS